MDKKFETIQKKYAFTERSYNETRRELLAYIAQEVFQRGGEYKVKQDSTINCGEFFGLDRKPIKFITQKNTLSGELSYVNHAGFSYPASELNLPDLYYLAHLLAKDKSLAR